MATQNLHHGIEFANRYALGIAQGNFNAATALGRLRTLASDIESVGAAIEIAKDHEDANDGDWHRFREMEIFSYYAVGIVTCLEWHARSRLTDLFSYIPGSIGQDDLKPLANARMMAQMVENNVSAAQLLGGMTTVATADLYMIIIGRVFEKLQVSDKIHDLINAKAEPQTLFGNGKGGIERLQRIFEFRNTLVHEIGIEVSGSFTTRDTLGAEQALEWCRFAIDCVESIEAKISEVAPTDFPNCLNGQGYARGDVEALDVRIEELEDNIAKLFEIKGRRQDMWQAALELSSSARTAESDLCTELYIRHFENSTPVRLSIRKSRISYLQFLKKALENLPDHE